MGCSTSAHVRSACFWSTSPSCSNPRSQSRSAHCCSTRASARRILPAAACSPSPCWWVGPAPARRRLDELDLVAVRILDERDDRPTVLHRAWLAHDLAATRADLLAHLVNVGRAKGHVSERVAELVAVRVPVVGELEHG